MFFLRERIIVWNFEFWSRAAQALAPRVVICPSTILRVVSLSNHLIFGICILEFPLIKPVKKFILKLCCTGPKVDFSFKTGSNSRSHPFSTTFLVSVVCFLTVQIPMKAVHFMTDDSVDANTIRQPHSRSTSLVVKQFQTYYFSIAGVIEYVPW